MGDTKVRPPNSRIGPVTPEERARVMQNSPVAGIYDTPVNRESAYEKLAARTEATAAGSADEAKAPVAHGGGAAAGGAVAGAIGRSGRDRRSGVQERSFRGRLHGRS